MWVLISASCRVIVGNCIVSAQHPPFQSRTALPLAHVILGCLPLTIAMWPKLCAEIKELDTQLNYSWWEPFLETYHLNPGWESFLLVRSQAVCLWATTLSSVWGERMQSTRAGPRREARRAHRGTESKPASDPGVPHWDSQCILFCVSYNKMCSAPGKQKSPI